MAPKAVVYHICGQHLCGEAVVGYAVGPDTPIMLAPKLNLRGGAVVQRRPAMAAPRLNLFGKAGSHGGPPQGPRVGIPSLFLRGGAAVGGFPPGPRYSTTPKLNLNGVPTFLSISQTFTVSPTGGEIFLDGGPHIVGKEKALVPTRPENILLPPTVEEDWLLIPTTERDM